MGGAGAGFTDVLPRLTANGARGKEDAGMDTRATSSSASVHLALHAYPQITIDGRPRALKLKPGLALLAHLCRRARPVGRDALATLLWPDAPAGRGRARLRRLVHEMHGALGHAVIAGDVDALWLAGGIDSDLQRTQAAIDTADVAVLCETQAAGLLEGFTFNSDVFADWLDSERRVQRAALVRALERAIDVALATQQGDVIERAGDALLRLEPTAEAGHIARLTARAVRGDAAGVEGAYFESARLWREELGARPSARIEAAYARAQSRLQRGDVAASIVVMWHETPDHEAGPGPQRLRALLDRLARRHRVVLIEHRAADPTELATA
jgi:DNA-binding SARP family transcriptional activator